MQGFENLDDYLISAWMRDGVMIRVSNVVRTIETKVKSAGSVVAVTTAVAFSFVLPTYSNSVVGGAHFANSPHDATVANADNFRPNMEFKGSRYGDIDDLTEEKIDPVTLTLARQAIQALAHRGDSAPDGWAKRMATGQA